MVKGITKGRGCMRPGKWKKRKEHLGGKREEAKRGSDVVVEVKRMGKRGKRRDCVICIVNRRRRDDRIHNEVGEWRRGRNDAVDRRGM